MKPSHLICLTGFLFVFYATASVDATTLTVTNTADFGAGSLRQAIADAGAGDTIVFAAPLFDTPQVIRSNGQLVIDKSLIITGGAANLLTVRNVAAASGTSRVFLVNAGTTVHLTGMTAQGGNTTGDGGGIMNNGTLTVTGVHVTGNIASGLGGGIFNTATLNVVSSTLSNNIANATGNSGGGLHSTASLAITNSTISGNGAPNGASNGGGVWSGTGSATITNSTITDNEGAGANSGGGVLRSSGTITVRNTIIAANRSNSTTPDVAGGSFSSDGYNIIGHAAAGSGFANAVNNDQVGNSTTQINPLVFPLGNYGRGVPTHALRRFPTASPAIDNGATAAVVTTDARGVPRPFDEAGVNPTTAGGNNADIGAFEHLPYVNNNSGAALADSGVGSLRGTYSAAPAGTFVVFDPDFFGNSFFTSGGIARTIGLNSGHILANKNISIVGTTANALTIQNTAPSAGPNNRVFLINSGTTANLSGMTVTGGFVSGGSGGGILNNGTLTLFSVHVTGNLVSNFGGGIANAGTLNVYHSTISNNQANNGGANNSTGGGIDNIGGTLRVTNSTVSGNRTPLGIRNGGGIRSSFGGSATILNTTITDNEADGAESAGGVFRQEGTVTISNTIIAANRSNSTVPDVANGTGTGVFVSQGYNLIGNRGAVIDFNQTGDQTGTSTPLNPALSALASNGGQTPTHALLGTSPAFDKGNCFGCSLDQRLVMRPFDDPSVVAASGGDNSEIGAFELPSVIPTAVVSRKLHNSVPYDINLPLTGTPGVECRSGGATNAYQIVLSFPAPITYSSAAVTSGAGSVSSSSGSGTNTVTLDLSGVTNAQRLTVTLAAVNDGSATNNVAVTMAVLIGDTNGSGGVNATDIGQTKAASGQPVDATNFRRDVNVSGGSINASDIGLVKAQSGSLLPPGAAEM